MNVIKWIQCLEFKLMEWMELSRQRVVEFVEFNLACRCHAVLVGWFHSISELAALNSTTNKRSFNWRECYNIHWFDFINSIHFTQTRLSRWKKIIHEMNFIERLCCGWLASFDSLAAVLARAAMNSNWTSQPSAAMVTQPTTSQSIHQQVGCWFIDGCWMAASSVSLVDLIEIQFNHQLNSTYSMKWYYNSS